ncbi:hypothetical protein CO726_17875 [Bacillus fungorum]|uniref:Uncharacterized protein n=1 Tax=Bacillus fungorum TaxID=2039284 RepID=A0A2G6QB66_9BACI|nr:hypothetical protein CO726_17875 [Bacillus fungorum]
MKLILLRNQQKEIEQPEEMKDEGNKAQYNLNFIKNGDLVQQKVINDRENPCRGRDFIGAILLSCNVEIWRIR